MLDQYALGQPYTDLHRLAVGSIPRTKQVGKRIRGEDSQAGTAQRSRKNEAIRGLRIDDCQYQTVSFTPRTEILNKRGEGPDAESYYPASGMYSTGYPARA